METVCLFLSGRRSVCMSSIITLFLLFNISCNKQEKLTVMEFEGAESVCNYSKSLSYFVGDSFNAPAALTGRDDLLECIYEGELLYLINEGLPAGRIKISVNDTAWYINDKLYALKISEEVDLNPWLMTKHKKDLSNLKFINIERNLDANDLPLLKKLAELKPDAGFIFSNEEDKLDDITRMFNPKYLLGVTLHNNNIRLLEGLTNLEYLWASVEEKQIIKELPAVPGLRSILIMSEEASLPEGFLSNNSQIQQVVISGADYFDLNVLSPLKNLRNFNLMLADSLVNHDLINKHRQLHSLNLSFFSNTDNINLPDLRRVTFSSETSQAGFDNFLLSHPKLEAIEIMDNQQITSLDHLADLENLMALSIVDTVTDIISIQKLSKLQYLSLPDDYIGKPETRAALQKSLPNTHLAANEGFCMGSGWILLLLPLILIFWYIHKKIIPRRTIP
jgi:hypothetical protein